MGMEAEFGGPTFSPSDVAISDSEAISTAISMIRDALILSTQGDQTRYLQLIEEITNYDPRDPVQESMLAMTLRALSGAIASLDYNHHKSLLSFIFDMSMWNCGSDVADAWSQFIVNLAASNSEFVSECLIKIVSNFLPPTCLSRSLMAVDSITTRWIMNGLDRRQLAQKTAELLSRREEVLPRVHMALEDMIYLVPQASLTLGPILVHAMPKKLDPKNFNVLYLENILMLEKSKIGQYIRNYIWKAVIYRLVDLDVDIKWEDILKEDNSKCIFAMELEDGEENEYGNEMSKTERLGEVADKLDNMMDTVFEHLKTCVEDGRLLQVFEILMESFQSMILNTSKSKFVQFVLFYACSLDPERCGEKFGNMLADIFLGSSEPRNARMSAVAYLASYMSRARFLPSYFVTNMLDRLVKWCLDYYQTCQKKSLNPEAHQVFYSGCQAIMYVLCFRMRSFMEAPMQKSQLLKMRLDVILHNNLEPLKVCLPSIAAEFLKQATRMHILSSKNTIPEGLLDSVNSKAFGGIDRLDMFFPFDPYLLKKSDRFIRPLFTFWTMVERKYSDDEDDDDGDNASVNSDVDTDGDNVEYGENGNLSRSFVDFDVSEFDYSLSMMSITPKDSLKSKLITSPTSPVSAAFMKMPAKLRPSTSPDW